MCLLVDQMLWGEAFNCGLEAARWEPGTRQKPKVEVRIYWFIHECGSNTDLFIPRPKRLSKFEPNLHLFIHHPEGLQNFEPNLNLYMPHLEGLQNLEPNAYLFMPHPEGLQNFEPQSLFLRASPQRAPNFKPNLYLFKPQRIVDLKTQSPLILASRMIGLTYGQQVEPILCWGQVETNWIPNIVSSFWDHRCCIFVHIHL